MDDTLGYSLPAKQVRLVNMCSILKFFLLVDLKSRVIYDLEQNRNVKNTWW